MNRRTFDTEDCSLSILADARLQDLIEKARADLAQQLSLTVDEVVVLENTSVAWPDGSLRCSWEPWSRFSCLRAKNPPQVNFVGDYS